MLKCIESLIGRCRSVQEVHSYCIPFGNTVFHVVLLCSMLIWCVPCRYDVYLVAASAVNTMSILVSSVLRWEGHERSGYSSLESHCTGNLPDYKFIWSLFRFLQLLCEGHNEGTVCMLPLTVHHLPHLNAC